MTAATASTPEPLTAARGLRGLVTGPDLFVEYERDADPTVCLHLPADQCDHVVYRCLSCCVHEE